MQSRLKAAVETVGIVHDETRALEVLRESYTAARGELESELARSEPAALAGEQAQPRARVFLSAARRRALAASAERLRIET